MSDLNFDALFGSNDDKEKEGGEKRPNAFQNVLDSLNEKMGPDIDEETLEKLRNPQTDEEHEAQQEYIHDKFMEKFGDMEGFMKGYMEKRGNKFAKELMETTSQQITGGKTKKVSANVAIYGMMDVAREIASRIGIRTFGPSKGTETLMRSANLARQLDEQLPDENMADTIAIIVGLTAVVQMKAAELEAHVQAEIQSGLVDIEKLKEQGYDPDED